jgi:23S rRNA (adenine2503-C2)-methyltransferase
MMEIKIIQSAESTVKKLVFTEENAVSEAVLYRYPTYEDRTVICCSTQSGCPVGCRFCGAGDYFVRNLSATEIVAQVHAAVAESHTDASAMQRLQIMFMSMGEPMLNWHGISGACQVLAAEYPHAALLISTIGPRVDYSGLIALSSRIPKIGLQFSVHKSTDAERDKLIPFKAKLRLDQIAIVGQTWANATGRRPFFNYCAADDNTSDDDADRLAATFLPSTWEATVSVICERNEGLPARNAHQEALAKDFSEKLLARGFNVRVFDPAGQDDIGGGCGQLWFVQDWMRQNPKLAKPSVGRGLPKIHVPGLKGGE